MVHADLRRTLVMTADAMATAQDPWWVISSVAVALHGITPIALGDVDVLTSVSDADRVLTALGVTLATDSGSSLFRSAVFGRWTVPPLVVEIMADLHVASAAGWIAVIPQTRVLIVVEGRVLYVPDQAALAAMITPFGRPKHLTRARLLKARGSWLSVNWKGGAEAPPSPQ